LYFINYFFHTFTDVVLLSIISFKIDVIDVISLHC